MKWAYLGLGLVFAILTAVMLVKTTPAGVVVVMPKSYSRYQSDPLESLVIEVLANQPDSYHYDVGYIEQVQLHDDTQSIAMEVDDIDIGTVAYEWNNQDFYRIRFVLSPAIEWTTTTVSIPQATMLISYGNGESLSLAIGELQYVVASHQPSDLSLGGLSALVGYLDEVETVTGIQVEWYNRSDDVIDLIAVDVVSSVVHANLGMAQTDLDCSHLHTIEACLGIEQYELRLPAASTSLHKTILPNQSLTLIVPLLYDQVVPFHRFVMEVTYEINGEIQTLYLDDFPFVQSPSFQSSYEPWYVTYDLD